MLKEHSSGASIIKKRQGTLKRLQRLIVYELRHILKLAVVSLAYISACKRDLRIAMALDLI
jgi:hypothetical protein